jgi:hypothetical protein
VGAHCGSLGIRFHWIRLPVALSLVTKTIDRCGVWLRILQARGVQNDPCTNGVLTEQGTKLGLHIPME